jgi:predicted ester cyclase
MDLDGNKALVARYWARAWNEQDSASLNDTHAPWFAQNGVPLGVARFRELLAGFLESFPDMHVTIEDVVADGDRVVMRVTYRGTHLGEYQGIAPTGRTVGVGGLEMFLILGGRIVQHWHETDHLGILQQIGCRLVPPTSKTVGPEL